MSSANSIVRFYQNSSTANNSHDEFVSRSPSSFDQQQQLQQSSSIIASPRTLPSSLFLKTIDNLPTPMFDSTPLEKLKGYDQNNRINSGLSFFTKPWKRLSLKRNHLTKKPQLDVLSATFSEFEDEEPIDIISDSPIENFLPERHRVPIEEVSAYPLENEIDPIYETYVKYVYQNPDDDVEIDVPQTFQNPFDSVKPVQEIVDLESKVLHQSGAKSQRVNNENIKVNEQLSNVQLSRSSTLSRLKNKTKGIMKQISSNYENEVKTLNDSSYRIKNGVKRRLSGVSLKRSTPSQRWRWGTKRIKLSFMNGEDENGPYGRQLDDDLDLKGGNSLLNLFQSSEFQNRLQEGVVVEREYFPNDSDGDYQLDYKFENDFKENPARGRTSSFQSLATRIYR